MWTRLCPLWLALPFCLCADVALESYLALDGYEVFPSYNASRYKVLPHFFTWTAAMSFCQKDGDGSHLVDIASEAEAAVVREMIDPHFYPMSYLWAGISDIATQGRWVTLQGDPVSESGYNKWSSLYGPTSARCGEVSDYWTKYCGITTFHRNPACSRASALWEKRCSLSAHMKGESCGLINPQAEYLPGSCGSSYMFICEKPNFD